MLLVEMDGLVVRLQQIRGAEDVQTHSNGHRLNSLQVAGTGQADHTESNPHSSKCPFVVRWRAGAEIDWVNMCVVAESFSVARTCLGKHKSQ